MVLSYTEKHLDKPHTGTRMSRHADPSSLDTNTTDTRLASSAYQTYAFAQRHKSDKNIPVNLAKTATAALPFPAVLTSKCSVKINKETCCHAAATPCYNMCLTVVNFREASRVQ